MSATPAVLVAGGVDPTGGAGLTADIAFLARVGVRAGTVVTALTVQDDDAVRRVETVEPALFDEQLDAALRTLAPGLGAFKTGLVMTAHQAGRIADAARGARAPLIVDPVLVAGTGDAFHESGANEALAPLLDAATLLTPNVDEAQVLTGRRWDGSDEGLLALAAALATPTRTAAVSGGHGTGPTVPLAVAGPGGTGLVQAARRVGARTHGTGCAMASATAGLVARGLDPARAAVEAHRLVARTVVNARGLPGRRVSPEPWSV